MNREIKEELNKKAHLIGGHMFMAYGHFELHKMSEAHESTADSKKALDRLIEYIDSLECE